MEDEEELEEQADFLSALPVVYDEEDEDEAKPTSNKTDGVYKHRKPMWWIRKSKKASKAQRRARREMQDYTLMRAPYGQVLDWDTVFSPTTESSSMDIWLEIGFGAGENLLRLAEQYHGTCKRFVGAEIHAPGSCKALQRMQESMQKKQFWKGYTLYSREIDPFCPDESVTQESEANCEVESSDQEGCVPVEDPYSNLRIHCGDGIRLLPSIPPKSLAAILITNPDPFPNAQDEWRIIQTYTLRSLHQALRQGGRLYLTTDHAEFYQWSHHVMGIVNEEEEIFRLIDPCPDREEWLPAVSAYEQRGWEGERCANLACWEVL